MAEVTKEIIRDGLGRLGVTGGDCVFVHSSLSSLGTVAGGADAVIDALLDAVGPRGHVVMPAFSWSFVGSTPYHRLRTPSKVGRVTEHFRLRKGVSRSAHPTHSVAAVGPEAQRITANHDPTESPFGRHGPWGAMYELDTKVIFLGCTLRPNSTMHAVEDWADMPYLGRSPRTALLADDEGNVTEVAFPKEPPGHRAFYLFRSTLERALDAEGVIRDEQIAGASVQLIHMRDIFRVTLARLGEDPAFLLCDSPVCESCRENRAKIVVGRDEIASRVRRLAGELDLHA